MKSTAGLRKVTLHNVRLTDADISDILAANALQQLEEIHISAGTTINLTEQSVYNLIDKCPR